MPIFSISSKFFLGWRRRQRQLCLLQQRQLVIANEGEATLQVIDITGRILSSETINGSISKGINHSAGIYMIRLINGENVKTQKIVIE